MATPRYPTYLTPRSGGGDKTIEFNDTDCLPDSTIPDSARNEISLPRSGSTTLTQGDRIRQNNVSYILTSNATINISTNGVVSDTNLTDRFVRVADLGTGSGGGGGLDSVSTTPDRGLTGDGTSANPLAVDPAFSKLALFLGIPGANQNEPVVFNPGPNVITTTYSEFVQSNGTSWFFVDGINIGSSDRITAGEGVWTTAFPDSETLTESNSFNLIG